MEHGMRRNLRSFSQSLVVATVLFASFPCSAGWYPFGIGLLGTRINDVTQFPSSWDSVYGFNLSCLCGRLDDMQGLCVAGFGMDTEAVAGIEISGIFNWARSLEGGAIQVAGVFNRCMAAGQGMQISGIANVSSAFFGLQVALANLTDQTSGGLQIGGFNCADASSVYSGAQIGAVNLAGDMRDRGDFSGAQIGAFNFAGKMSGVQIGVVNRVANGFSGVQLGAVNIVSDSSFQLFPILRVAID